MPHISTYHTIYIDDQPFFPDDDDRLFNEDGQSQKVTSFYCEGDCLFIGLDGEDPVQCVGFKGE